MSPAAPNLNDSRNYTSRVCRMDESGKPGGVSCTVRARPLWIRFSDYNQAPPGLLNSPRLNSSGPEGWLLHTAERDRKADFHIVLNTHGTASNRDWGYPK